MLPEPASICPQRTWPLKQAISSLSTAASPGGLERAACTPRANLPRLPGGLAPSLALSLFVTQASLRQHILRLAVGRSKRVIQHAAAGQAHAWDGQEQGQGQGQGLQGVRASQARVRDRLLPRVQGVRSLQASELGLSGLASLALCSWQPTKVFAGRDASRDGRRWLSVRRSDGRGWPTSTKALKEGALRIEYWRRRGKTRGHQLVQQLHDLAKSHRHANTLLSAS